MTSKKTQSRVSLQLILLAGYAVFIGFSFALGFEPGEEIGKNFWEFSRTMLLMLPGIFLLVGLFEVWVKRETVERHLGESSGVRGYIWAIFLAGTTFGPLYVALPLACTLSQKGAKLSVLLTYISASAVCRIPMTGFEASFLGIKFTLIRLFVSLPLVVGTSMLLGKYLSRIDYRMEEGK